MNPIMSVAVLRILLIIDCHYYYYLYSVTCNVSFQLVVSFLRQSSRTSLLECVDEKPQGRTQTCMKTKIPPAIENNSHNFICFFTTNEHVFLISLLLVNNKLFPPRWSIVLINMWFIIKLWQQETKYTGLHTCLLPSINRWTSLYQVINRRRVL